MSIIITKTIADFHSPEFTAERLALIEKVVTSGKASIIRHVYLSRKITSTLWPHSRFETAF